MDLTILYFLTNMLVLILEREAYSVSISAADHGSERGFQAQLREHAAPREKRCSCENLKDKECVYFCHIGIVWVNTPGQIVPYGVGSFPVRLRRDGARCVCAGSSDSECLQFCTASRLFKEQVGITPFKRIPQSQEENTRVAPQTNGRETAYRKYLTTFTGG